MDPLYPTDREYLGFTQGRHIGAETRDVDACGRHYNDCCGSGLENAKCENEFKYWNKILMQVGLALVLVSARAALLRVALLGMTESVHDLEHGRKLVMSIDLRHRVSKFHSGRSVDLHGAFAAVL